jgi:hypothetical protein
MLLLVLLINKLQITITTNDFIITNDKECDKKQEGRNYTHFVLLWYLHF